MSKPNNTQRVREVLQRIGRGSRPNVFALLPDMDRKHVNYAIDSMTQHKEIVPNPKKELQTHIDVMGRSRPFEYIIFDYVGRAEKPLSKSAHSKKAVQAKPSGYAPGHFTADIRASSWAGLLDHGYGQQASAAPASLLQTVQRRESDSATGKGWGSGTSVMPGTPNTARPAMMGKAP